jgi:hypothetical protein
MSDVIELWSLPWRKLQENLANGSGADASGKALLIGESEFCGRAASSNSWLARALSRKAQRYRTVQ